MLGKKDRNEKMFYYVKIDDLIPEDHLLKLVHRYVDLGFVRKKMKHLYSHTGRPSIDPEVLLRMLLVGYLYGITSERRLCEEVKMHLGYRWFVGLSLEDKVPDHSTFSHNRHDRFAESNLIQEIFDEIVAQCIAHGLVGGERLTVDAAHIKANASFKSMEPVVGEMKPKEYREKPAEENDKPWEPPTGEKRSAIACAGQRPIPVLPGRRPAAVRSLPTRQRTLLITEATPHLAQK